MDRESERRSTLGDLLRFPFQALTARIVADLTAVGFTDIRASHLAVFKHLQPGGSRLTDLAARAEITKQSMGALIDDLERWGYLERVTDPVDARARTVRQTARGLAVTRVAQASIRAFEEEWERQIGADRMHQFRRVLEEFAATQDGPPRPPRSDPR